MDATDNVKTREDRRRLLKASAAAPLIATLHPSNAFAISSAAACLHRPGVDKPDTAVKVKVKKFIKDSNAEKCEDLPDLLYKYDGKFYDEHWNSYHGDVKGSCYDKNNHYVMAAFDVSGGDHPDVTLMGPKHVYPDYTAISKSCMTSLIAGNVTDPY
ncbi:MAG: hypothetical protein AAF098_08730 [Pseudomonadota bacterium]